MPCDYKVTMFSIVLVLFSIYNGKKEFKDEYFMVTQGEGFSWDELSLL